MCLQREEVKKTENGLKGDDDLYEVDLEGLQLFPLTFVKAAIA